MEEENIKVETTVEDEQFNKVKLPDPIVISKIQPGETPYGELVETARKDLFDQQKRGKRLSNIAMVVVIALLVLAVSFLNVVPLVAYISLGVCAVVLIAFLIINKRIARPDVKGYVALASTAINRYIYNDARFEDVTFDPNDKLDLSEVFTDGIYEGIINLASRNVVNGKVNGHKFKCSELALYTGSRTRRGRQDLFIGKYLTIPNTLHFEDRYIIAFKPEKEVDMPNAVDDLKTLFSCKNYAIYGKNGANYNSDLGKGFINSLTKISVKNHLLNLNIVVWAGRTVIYASYDDQTIVLPFYNSTDVEPYESFKKDLHRLCDIALTLCKE